MNLTTFLSDERPMNALHLRRLDPTRNMRRFYRLDVQPDLFGGVLLMKQWGRVGTQGRMVAESYESEAPALGLSLQGCERKQRRGYEEIPFCIIAVGTPITGRPPHRSLQARFTHKAPTSDV
jgi:predicted DNA-binding WGR domain protein